MGTPREPRAGPHIPQGAVFHALAPFSQRIPEAAALWEGGKAGRLQGWEAFAPGAFLSQHFDKAGAKGCDLSGSCPGQFPLLRLLGGKKAAANYPCGFKVPLPYLPLKLLCRWELFADENLLSGGNRSFVEFPISFSLSLVFPLQALS